MVLQHGYFGTRNYGDERSAWAAREMVRRVVPNAEFTILGSSQANLERYHGDCAEVATRDNRIRVIELAKRADVVIYGPGTVLGDEVVFRTEEILEAERPLIIWGAGAWTGLNPAGAGAKVLREARGVAVRDLFAQNAADAILCPSMRPCSALVGDPMLIDVRENDKRVLHGVNVSWHLAAREPEWVQKYVLRAVAGAMAALGGEWLGIPASWPGGDVWATTFDNDIWMLGMLGEQVANRVPFSILHPETFDDVAGALAGVDLMVTSRLHLGIPVLGAGQRAVYFGQDKCQRMAASLGAPKIYAGGYMDVTIDSLVAAARAECSPVFMDEDYSESVMREFLVRAGAVL